jgi:A/G-specific adenine glycosylase
MTKKQSAHGAVPSQPQSGAWLSDCDVPALRRRLLAWYRAHRRDLPWRRTRDPYAIWVSEIMLQQTRVDTVVPYYERFLASFPTVNALADASSDEVMRAWAGLGYYRRARMMHEGARQLRDERGGAVPSTRDDLRAVRGVGPYTAGAIASIAFGEAVGLVDGNVARVLSRVFAIELDMKASGARVAADIADALVAPRAPGDFNQALMELGATVCTPRGAACDACPLRDVCRARAEGRVEELPRVAPRAAPRVLAMRALVVSSTRAVVLGRRRSTLRFGGMWEPPCIEGEGAAPWPTWLDAERGVALVRHVLTHRRLEVAVDAARTRVGDLERARAALAGSLEGTYDTVRAVPHDAIDAVGLTALAQKVLAAARSRA